MADRTKPRKVEVARELLRRGNAFIHLDPRHNEVIVPMWLKQQAQLVLFVGHNLAVPIPDLTVTESVGISGTLSFSGKQFFCLIPWDSIYALIDDNRRGIVWDESVPREVHMRMQEEEQPRETPPASPTPARPRVRRHIPSYLKLVK